MYDLNKINNCLNTISMGRTIIQYDTLDSTYAKAKSIFHTCPDGAVVLAEYLSKWNVRMGREWVCYPEKNIYLSIILKSMENNHLTSKFDAIGCVSACEAVNTLYNVESKIKWPNDIIINDRKISSVSSSIVCKNNKPEGIILSIAINSNMTEQELESVEELKSISTSLMVESSNEIDREILIGELINNVEKYYTELIAKNTISNAMNSYNLNSAIINKDIEIMKKGKKSKRRVCVVSVDGEGWLIVKNDKGNEEILGPGETIITYEKNA